MGIRSRNSIPFLLLLALGACGEAINNPEATFHAEGTILSPSGAPLGAQEVGFWRYEPVGALLTGGLALLPQLAPRATTKTDQDGKFRFEVLGSETHVVGVPSVFRVATRGESHGGGSDLFFLSDGSRTISPIRLWNGVRSVQLVTGNGEPEIAVAWDAAASAAGDPVSEYRVEISGSGGVAWIHTIDAAATSTSIPQLVLPKIGEPYTVSVSAHHGSGNYAWAEPRSIRPLAVRAAVALVGVTASENGGEASRVNDGEFMLPWVATPAAAGSAREVQLTAELAEEQFIARALLHGLATGGRSVIVEASTTGDAFVEVARIQPANATNWIDQWFDEPVRARFVRLRFPAATGTLSLSELRIF